jgi:serine/threonine protein kinase/predicted Zn-dependent protease
MGVVYWVWQSGLNRPAALKMLLAGAHAGPDELARFQTEAEAVARLQHPHIVQVYEIGEHEGRPYLVLEYVDGGSLDRKLDGTPLPAALAARWMEALARAMHYAHQRGVIHRDLKPGNILLQRKSEIRNPKSETTSKDQNPKSETPGRPVSVLPDSGLGIVSDFGFRISDFIPKITDFGLAKLLVGGDTNQTQTGSVLGTPSYMAPEQAAGRPKEVGPATDVHALGAILYTMLTGLPPFRGLTALETLEQVQLHEPVPPTRLQSKVPRDLETICLKCLQKEPRKRYASAQALADDLGRFLGGEPIQARPTPAWERAGKWARRRPTAAALAAVSSLAVLALLSVSLWFNAKLQAALDQTQEEKRRTEEHRARLVEQAQVEYERVQALRDETQKLLLAGQAATARKDWLGARLHLSRARAKLDGEGELADLAAHVDRVLTEAEAELNACTNYHRFQELRDEALFHGTLFTGMDLPANLEATRTAAWQALGLFGLTQDAGTRLTFPDCLLNEQDQAEVTVGCYELFLVLAEAVAHPLPGQLPAERRRCAEEALGLLERAKQLGLTTQAYHRRRVEYLTRLGDEAGAEAERRQAQQCQPTSASDHFLVGDQFYKADNLAAAREHFDRTLRSDPDHFWAQYFLAVCQLKLDRPREAVAHLTACLSRQPGFAWVYLLRGHAYGCLGDFQTAEADFQKASQLDASQYGLYVNRAATRIKQGKLAEARADLRQAIALKPEQYQAYVNLAEVYRQQRDYDRALRHLDKAIQLAPSAARSYGLRARVHLERQDLPTALSDLEQALRLEVPGSRSRAEYLFEKGRILHRQQNYQEALAAYDAALESDPDQVTVHRWRADTLLALKRDAEALAAFDRYLSQEPGDSAAHRQRGFERAKLGDHAGALADYTRALELEPGSAPTRARRGWAYLNEAARLALADFEEAIKAHPDNGELYNGRGYARVLLGQVREGVADAEEALRRGPAGPERRQRLALTSNAACVYARAVGLVASAGHDPGRQELAQQYHDRAVELLRQTLDLVPPAARGLYVQEVVLPEPAFDPIRTSPAFTNMVAKYVPPAQ